MHSLDISHAYLPVKTPQTISQIRINTITIYHTIHVTITNYYIHICAFQDFVQEVPKSYHWDSHVQTTVSPSKNYI